MKRKFDVEVCLQGILLSPLGNVISSPSDGCSIEILFNCENQLHPAYHFLVQQTATGERSRVVKRS